MIIVSLRASANLPELPGYAESETAESAQLLSNAALQRVALDN
jgi:hypothetical protein